MPVLPLSPDELLSTTRSVRKRLDLTRPVERTLIEECITLAQQAPTGSNSQSWHFVVVTDAAKRRVLADLYRQSWKRYIGDSPDDPANRIRSSSQYLADHLHEVPVHVIPCIRGRTEQASIAEQASVWGSILQAAWSFMLAARARGLGSAWTSLHLAYEKEAADLLGIPFAEIMQAALLPVAYSKGTAFKPAPRAPLDTMTHWDKW